MPAYQVNHSYRSSTQGPFEAGAVLELDEATAEWVNRDSPGCLELVVDEPVPAEPVKSPPAKTNKGRA
jgi:hypothetical protein